MKRIKIRPVIFDCRPLTFAILLLAAAPSAHAISPLANMPPLQAAGREAVFAAYTDPNTVTTTLPSGLRIVCRRETGVPLVAVDIFVRSDNALAEQPALGSLLARTVTLSTSNVIADSLATQIGDLGGSLGASWQTDTIQINALVVRDRFRDVSFLLSDILRNADFDPEGTGVDDAKQQLLTDIDNSGNSLFQAAYALARKKLYAGSPYALPALGTEDDAARLTRADLMRTYNHLFVPANMTVVVDGDIDPQYALQKVSDDLADFPAGRTGSAGHAAAPSDAPTPLTSDPSPIRRTIPGLAEAAVMVGYQMPDASSPDYPALLVANALLGNMKTSRLFTSLREKLGLGYEVGSLLNTRFSGGDLVAYALAAPTYADKAAKKTVPTIPLLQAQILHQTDSFKATPPTDAETLRAVHYLLGSDKVRRERLEDRAAILGQETLLHGDAAAWEARLTRDLHAVTPADVQRVAAHYFVHPVVVIIGPDAPTPDNPDTPGNG